MRRGLWLLLLASLMRGAMAGECDAVRASGLRLLPQATFEVTRPGLLNGCFAGYLPDGIPLEGGLYRFGVFRNGQLAVPFPVIHAGMDLSSEPSQHLKILAVSFADLDRDGRNDVMVIGENVAAKGEIIFAQIYWNCGDRFIYDPNVDDDVALYFSGKPTINVKTIQRYVHSKNMKGQCDAANAEGMVPFKRPDSK